MNTALHYALPGYGLGADPSGTAPTAMRAAGAVMLKYAPAAGPAAPFVAVAGAITELLGMIGIGGGCGQKCIFASEYADKAEPLLKQNYSTYFSLPTPRDPTVQQTALSNFDNVWAGLVQACLDPTLGDAGQRCITDRQAGACKWKDSSGNCWNWFSGYRDPIANDTQVGTSILPASVTSALTASGIDPSLLLLGGGLLLFVMFMSSL